MRVGINFQGDLRAASLAEIGEKTTQKKLAEYHFIVTSVIQTYRARILYIHYNRPSKRSTRERSTDTTFHHSLKNAIFHLCRLIKLLYFGKEMII